MAWVVCAAAGCERAPTDRFQGWIEGEFVHVASPLAGELEELAVARGEVVEPGDLLFVLEHEDEAAARDEAARRLAQAQAELENARKGARPSEIAALEAQVRQVEAALALARIELERQEGLVATNATSQTELDRARSERDQQAGRLAQLEADLATARLGAREDVVAAAEQEVAARAAALARAEWDLAQKRQTATQPAEVFDTLYEKGEWVGAGRPIVVLLPPGNVKLRAFIPQSIASTLQPGATVRVLVDGIAEPFLGRLTYVAPQVEYTPPVIFSRETRQKLVVMIEARFDPVAAARLHPGQPVDVVLGS